MNSTQKPPIRFDSIESALADLKQGKMVIVADDENRENEGDFIMAAELARDEDVNFMAKYGRGIICTPVTRETAQRLKLPLMVDSNTSAHSTAFTISIDLARGTKTGVSASDRQKTIVALADPNTTADDFLKPGHIFPLIARDGGVLTRPGHTEASVDLMKLAGLKPVAVICEIMNDDGTMMQTPDLRKFADQYHLKFITIKDLIAYITASRGEVKFESPINLPTEYGEFRMSLCHEQGKEHVILFKGNPSAKKAPLVRLHSECMTGDLFASQRCDCGQQLQQSLKLLQKSDSGILIYLRQEGRGIGLSNKLKAYALQDQGADTVQANHQLGLDADLREYRIAAEILKHFKINQIKLLTNNPCKVDGLTDNGIKVLERLPIEVEPQQRNDTYLKTKKDKMGHFLNFHQHNGFKSFH